MSNFRAYRKSQPTLIFQIEIKINVYLYWQTKTKGRRFLEIEKVESNKVKQNEKRI